MEIEQKFDDGETYHIEVKHGDSGPFTHIAHYPIKSGPQTYKSLNIFSIDGKSSDDPERYKINFWKARVKTPRYLGVESESEFKCSKGEVQKLLGFLENIYELEGLERGEHVIIRKDSPSTKAAASAVQAVKNCEDDVEEILMRLIGSINEMEVEPSDLDLSDNVVEQEAIKAEYAIKHARTKHLLEEYRDLISSGVSEKEYQSFFEDNPWLFGHEYVRKIDIRELTRGNEVDFCMESVDGYYDIIEIKTPEKTVLVEDSSHATYKASSKLSEAIAQVEHYIHAIEANEAQIKLDDGLHVLKPRGIIVIGDDLNSDERDSLRILNSHLNRITVYTFSDIADLGERFVKRYENEDDLPKKTLSIENEKSV